MSQIKDLAIIRTVANDLDLLAMQDPITGETYRITKGDLFAGLSSGGTPTVPTSKVFTYSFDGDKKGVLYYFGTNEGATAWENPVNSGVAIACSSVGAGDVTALMDRQPTYFYTQNSPNSWIRITLPKPLKCNYYSIRNRNNDGYYLRNWKFQGSNDAGTWVDLDTQTNNTVLDSASQWLSLPITNTTNAYRFFRLIQTGLDSSGYDFLCIGEIELYGEVIP